MAVKTFLLLNTLAASSTYGSLQDGGSVTTATTATGWTVGTTAATAYANQDYTTKITAATFGATPQPASAPANSGECWRSTSTYTGHVEAGTWTMALSVISVTAAASGSGKLRVRIWKSTNANGSSGTELTTSTMSTTAWSALTTSTAQNLTATQSIAAFTFANEYLFIEVACEIDGASASSTADVLIRIDGTYSLLTTPQFDISIDGVEYNGVIPSTGTAGQGNRVQSASGVFNGQFNARPKAYKMRGWYAAGSVFETWVVLGAPSTSPPSGHILTDIAVVGVLSGDD